MWGLIGSNPEFDQFSFIGMEKSSLTYWKKTQLKSNREIKLGY